MYGHPPLSTDSIGGALLDMWRFEVDDLTYAAVGYGSWHWLATDGEGSRWFVTADDPNGPFPVDLAYPLARRLEAAGLEFVRGPMPSQTGEVLCDVDGWLLSLWPWIDGRSMEFGRHATPADLDATTACLARLHNHRGVEQVPGLVEDWAVSGRPDLEALLDEPHGSGPYAAETVELLTRGNARIRDGLGRYDHLTDQARAQRPRLVITHGEPHAGNVVHTDSGARLIDWDTVKWAPIERDLWHLVDYDDWERGYGDVKVDDDLIELYRLNWELSEIADFAVLLLGATAKSQDHEVAITELRRQLPDAD
ncbi:MAG: phosphotransferase [Acidimicrobiia bacterium]|nr:phosphotransferase [Acidimicrobiia bacterium]